MNLPTSDSILFMTIVFSDVCVSTSSLRAAARMKFFFFVVISGSGCLWLWQEFTQELQPAVRLLQKLKSIQQIVPLVNPAAEAKGTFRHISYKHCGPEYFNE